MTELGAKAGDEVVITLAGKVATINEGYVELVGKTDGYIELYAEPDDYSVTVTAPAVVKYDKPGMVIKNMRTSNVYTVLPGNKVYSHQTGRTSLVAAPNSMTSKGYELIAGG